MFYMNTAFELMDVLCATKHTCIWLERVQRVGTFKLGTQQMLAVGLP